MHVELGTAPDSWGIWFPSDPRQTPWPRFLDEVAEAGYRAIELGPFGYLPTDPVELRRELERRSIQLSGAFVVGHLEDACSWASIREELGRICEVMEAFDARYLGILDTQYSDPVTGETTGPKSLDDLAWQQLIDTTHRIGEYAATRGIRALLHPHAETPVEYEEQIERFLNHSDPSLVNLVLDVGHHAYRGGDPVRFLRQHSDRIPYLHLKSVDGSVREIVQRNDTPWAEAVSMGIFSEPANGVVDFIGLREALQAVDYEGWAIVEQDMYPAPPEKPLPIAKRTRAYFKHIGLG